jgi:hypothetical protein
VLEAATVSYPVAVITFWPSLSAERGASRRGTTTPARVYEYYKPRQEGRSEQALLVVKDK